VLNTGIRVLAYYGEKDFVTNWEGGLMWATRMKWSGQKGFGNA
jgi:cathepsin A (carboxypeptidase C)